MQSLIEDYKAFLDGGKTERRCVMEVLEAAEKAGYKDISKTKTLKAGSKVYYQKMGKSVILFNIGKDRFDDGMNILGAHIDSPRLDAKQNPVYEKDGLVYLNTHYYGGIKKYQWVTIPLSLCGVVVKRDGTVVEVCVGDEPDDPVFCISDILIHCAGEQMKKIASEFIEGEKLDVIIGSGEHENEFRRESKKSKARKDALKDGGEDCEDSKEARNQVKKNVLSILSEKYGFSEADLQSAEIEVVPAGRARYMGFDKSLILAYGQDDRSCAFASLRAMLDSKASGRTLCCILTDKEEIGSYGATGMDSHLLDNAVAEVVARLPESLAGNGELSVRRALANSFMLSSDVNAAFDPLNDNLYDRQNSSFLGGGLVFNKYTGSRGKSGASDANPEFIAQIRSVLDKADVRYQFAELAKVDVGGGGTIAHYAAAFGMQVIDAGVAVLSMHAPWEITSAFDIAEAYKGYKAFLTLR